MYFVIHGLMKKMETSSLMMLHYFKGKYLVENLLTYITYGSAALQNALIQMKTAALWHHVRWH